MSAYGYSQADLREIQRTGIDPHYQEADDCSRVYAEVISLKTESLAALCEAADYPTEGRLPLALWRNLSGSSAPCRYHCRDVYLACGYVPFSGYPLRRSDRLGTMTADQRAAVLKSHPLADMVLPAR